MLVKILKFLGATAAIFGYINVETPNYDAKMKKPTFEIRHYKKHIAVETPIEDDNFMEAKNRLDDYFGLNGTPINKEEEEIK